MAACRIVNGPVKEAVEKITTISTSYTQAGESFITELNASIADMEGDCKDAFQEYIDNNVKELVTAKLGDLVKGLATLLEANRQSFEDVDKEIAAALRK